MEPRYSSVFIRWSAPRGLPAGADETAPLIAGLRRLHSSLNRLRSTKAPGQTIEPDVHDGRGVKGEQLADQQSSDNADAQRLTQFGTGSAAYGQRQSSK